MDVPDSSFKNPAGTGEHQISSELSGRNQNWISEYLLHSKFFGFVCDMNKKVLFPVLVVFFSLRNDRYCVGWGVKLYSLTRLLFSALCETS